MSRPVVVQITSHPQWTARRLSVLKARGMPPTLVAAMISKEAVFRAADGEHGTQDELSRLVSLEHGLAWDELLKAIAA